MATRKSTLADSYYARNRERILAERKARYRDNHPLPERRACVVCGSEITTGRSDRSVCSELCQSRTRSPEQKAEYWRRYYAQHGDRLRANHRTRQSRNRKPIVSRPCQRCGESFTPKKPRGMYCSKPCQYAARIRDPHRENARRRQKSAVRRANIPVRACQCCGHHFKPKRRSTAVFCSERCAISAWGKDHPEVAYAGRLRRRARLRGVETETIKPLLVFQRDGWTCKLCGCPTPQRLLRTSSPHKPTVDHIVPIARGGAHVYANVQCACSRCNSRKAAKIKGQFRLF